MLLPRAYQRTILRLVLLSLVCASLLVWALLPYDSPVVLWSRMKIGRVTNNGQHFDRLSALWDPKPHFPVSHSDLGLVIKTGYGVQDRLVNQLESFEKLGFRASDIVLAGTYSTESGNHFNISNEELAVHDVVGPLWGQGHLEVNLNYMKARNTDLWTHCTTRWQKYLDLAQAISEGQREAARNISKESGWELDIMKHVSGLELGYKLMPNKKWYILLDDDTFLIVPSLLSLLQKLNPSNKHFLGNAVGGGFRKFAHGGSAIVFSQASMHRIFTPHSTAVYDSHLEALSAGWGDAMLAGVAIKSGIYLEHRYSNHFNGEPPRETKIRRENFCSEIVSMHHMSPVDMREAANIFHGAREPVLWSDLWKLYETKEGKAALNGATKVTKDWDFVGRLDEDVTTIPDVATAEQCAMLCQKKASKRDSCMAWSWGQEKKCHLSHWVTVGASVAGMSSGLNKPLIQELFSQCRPRP